MPVPSWDWLMSLLVPSIFLGLEVLCYFVSTQYKALCEAQFLVETSPTWPFLVSMGSVFQRFSVGCPIPFLSSRFSWPLRVAQSRDSGMVWYTGTSRSCEE